MRLLDVFRFLNRPEIAVKDPAAREALVRGPIAVSADGSLDRSLTMGDVRRYLNGLKADFRVSIHGFPIVADMDNDTGETVTYLCIPVALEPYHSDFVQNEKET